METCKKKVKESMRNIGIVYSRECGKPVYKDGLCHHHYQRMIDKSKCWGDRPNYRPATQEDFDRNRSMKLKASNVHHIYRYRKRDNSMLRYNQKANGWIRTDIAPDPELFCVNT